MDTDARVKNAAHGVNKPQMNTARRRRNHIETRRHEGAKHFDTENTEPQSFTEDFGTEKSGQENKKGRDSHAHEHKGS